MQRSLNTQKKQLVVLVSTACLSIGNAFASGSCTSSPLTTIDGNQSNTCFLDNGNSILITSNGELTDAGNGVVVSNGISAGRIENNGHLATGDVGIVVEGTLTNGILNAGRIDVDSAAGIQIIGGTITGGGITNSGAIYSNYGIDIQNSSITGGITNTGNITNAQSGPGISVWQSTINGDILNTGEIHSSGAGISADNSTVNGSITNTGLIDGAEGYGIAIRNDSIISGNVVNSGTISSQSGWGWGSGIEVSSSHIVGNIVNSGSIDVLGPGIEVWGGANINSIRNSGSITSNDVGIKIYDGSHIQNGIFNDVNGNIKGFNFGMLIADATVSGSITNAGIIQSIDGGEGGAGMSVTDSTVNGRIINSGLVSAPGATALRIYNSQISGTIENTTTGVIRGLTAIDASTTAPVTINNAGLVDGQVLLGDSTLNLNGNSGQVTGAVGGTSASTVNVNGTFTSQNTFDVGTFNINPGGNFQANNSVTVANGFSNRGTLSVGATTPFTINGNYTQAAGATYHIDALSPTQYSKTIVTGTATLAAGTGIDVHVASLANLTPNATLAGIIQAGQLNASTFKVTDDSALFNFDGVVNGNNVDLIVRQASTVYGHTVENRNFVGGGAARTFDSLIANNAGGDMGAVITALGRLSTSKQVSDAVKQTLPLITGGTTSATSSVVGQTGRIVQARQESNLGLSSGDDFISDKLIWAKPFGSWAKQGDRNGVSGFDAHTGGVVIGGDGVLSQHDRLGAAFTYAHTSVSSNDPVSAQSAKLDIFQAVLYGSHSIDERTELSWQGDVGINNTNGERYINFGGLNRKASSSYSGWSAHVGAGLGRIFSLSEAVNVIPSVRLDYTTVKNNSYTETGAGALNLQVDAQRSEELLLSTEGKLSYALDQGKTIVANLGVGYNLLSKNTKITSTFVGGGPAFATDGLDTSPWIVRGGVGVMLHEGNGVEITARYDAEANRTSFTNQTVSLKLRKSF